jgi:hypothetical protein
VPGPLLEDARGDLGRAQRRQGAPAGVADGVDRRRPVDQVLGTVGGQESGKPAEVAALAIGGRRELAQLAARGVDLALRLAGLALGDHDLLPSLLEPEPRAVVGLDGLGHVGG